MEIRVLRDKSVILTFLRKNKEIQFYLIGDLDDFFWPQTIWYCLTDKKNILSIALLYAGMEIPTLLLFYEGNPKYPMKLLKQIRQKLPPRMFAHLSPGLIDIFGRQNIIHDYGLHFKMVLRKRPEEINDPNIRRLSEADLTSILDLYSVACQDNWFNEQILKTGKYFGYFIGKKLAGISGIHVYSKEFKVSALGNIATHPDYRGQHIAFKLTSVLCNDLIRDVELIGLNVKSDNEYAIKCYSRIGFETTGKYEEFLIRNS